MISKNSSNNKNNNPNNIEDEQFNKIMKEINNYYRDELFYGARHRNKQRRLVKSRSNITSTDMLSYNNNNEHKSLKRENSLTFKLRNKINKESLILELRNELKYHIKFNYIYKTFLSRVIALKDIVKENKDKIEENTNMLKITFKDRFDIIDNYEKAITLLDAEKKDLMTTNKDILAMREKTHSDLVEQFNTIQQQNNEQRLKIEELKKKINSLEYKMATVNDELQSKLEADKKNYDKFLRLYNSLIRKYNFFLDEYNAYNKTGNEILSMDVKLSDFTNIKNSMIEEDLEIELNEKKIKRENLMKNITNLKNKIKILEEKKKEEQLKEEKKQRSLNYIRACRKNFRHSKISKINSNNKKHKRNNSCG